MYLSQLFLNPRLRAVQVDLANRYQLHRTVLSGFEGDSAVEARVLYRLEWVLRQRPMLLVQSAVPPDWQRSTRLTMASYLMSEPNVKPVELSITEGQVLRFRLYANPTVKRGGKRWALHTEDKQHAWLQRKAADHGFKVLDVALRDVKQIVGWHHQQHLTWHQVGYEGCLSVEDRALLLEAVQHGIGSAKAFGFGLLSLALPDFALRGG
ncbi:type I-E CRISPR-associated protein Cas6/Cse3/CasE [Aggregatilineales bacterium SYSU G02658]